MSNKKVIIAILVPVALILLLGASYILTTGPERDLAKATDLMAEKLGVNEESNPEIYSYITEMLETNSEAILQESDSLYDYVDDMFGEETIQEEVDYSTRELAVAEEDQPVATIKLKDIEEPMEFVLYPDSAPESVNNFISLANSGFYDGLTFHRVVCDFMAQGGDPEGTGAGGPGYSILGEFTENAVDNTLTNDYGTIAMARSSDYNSAGSQFYINTVDNSSLDGSYAVFGALTSGRDTLEYLNSDGVCNTSDGAPLVDITIESISVDTAGQTYDEPEKL